MGGVAATLRKILGQLATELKKAVFNPV